VSKAIRIALETPALAARVCGINSENIVRIEQAFDVLIEAPGDGFVIQGSTEAQRQAKAVLVALISEAKSGAELDEDHVRAAIRFAQKGDAISAKDGFHVPRSRRLISPRNPAQKIYLKLLKGAGADLVFGVGPAGTGKTFLAVCYGASLLAERKIDKLIIARPAVEAGERLGFLPGDMTEKIDPYMLPVWDALNEALGSEMVLKRRAEGRIEVAPLAFMRGRTLSHAFVILDEAQNATIGQMQMVLTRLGQGSRMIVTGDPSQSDLPSAQPSGLAHALSILDGVKGCAIARFTQKDVVRHPLVARIVEAYEAAGRTG
jgi:phosphate starvation-inducible protein PhoH and related proteins